MKKRLWVFLLACVCLIAGFVMVYQVFSQFFGMRICWRIPRIPMANIWTPFNGK